MLSSIPICKWTRTAAVIWTFGLVSAVRLDFIAAKGADSSHQLPKRAVSLSLENIVGFTPRDIVLESLESKTCFDMRNREQSVGTEVVLTTCGFPIPSSNQLFTLQDIDGQHFKISNTAGSCIVFTPTGSPKLVSTTQCTSDAAKFYLDYSADGLSFLIRQKATGKCVTPAGTLGSSEALKPTNCNRNDPKQYWRIFSKNKPRQFAPHPSRCVS